MPWIQRFAQFRVHSLFRLFETLSYVETEMNAFDMGWNGLRQAEIFVKDGSALRRAEEGGDLLAGF
jgi:hypothetical protein